MPCEATDSAPSSRPPEFFGVEAAASRDAVLSFLASPLHLQGLVLVSVVCLRPMVLSLSLCPVSSFRLGRQPPLLSPFSVGV